MANLYFERYAYPQRFIESPLRKGTFISVVIPVFKEPDLLPTLKSLVECEKTQHPVEVILVVNHPQNAATHIKEQSNKTVEQIEQFISGHQSDLEFHIIKAFDLSPKKAGVGLARKIGMDEAAYRFNANGLDGVILCFDADSTCERNYLNEVEKHFLNNPDCTGASIHYEHPLHYENGKINEAIVLYELHLRYYIQALKFTGYPFAFHTIGSSMAVRSSIYQKQGGMNQRKAGEDFYFLHKIIPLGNFHQISTTKVIPSPRLSDRVPFGTGRAMQEYKNQSKDLGTSYDFESFQLIRELLGRISLKIISAPIPHEIQAFLFETGLQVELEKVVAQSKDEQHFRDRFFEWFNGFKMFKLVHYLRDHYFPEKSLVQQADLLLAKMDIKKSGDSTALELLKIFKELDQGT